MGITRRDFFKLSAAGSASLMAGEALASDGAQTALNPNSLGVLVDTVACIGCRKCEWACNDANALPTQDLKAFEDKSVFARHRRPDAGAYTVVNQFSDPRDPSKKYSMKIQCMHCNRPACASACIVGALQKTPEGPVVYDAWKCIGCRYCMVACPFQIPAYEYDNALNPQVRKCTFCATRLSQEGKKPACVAICPNEALTFGKREDLLIAAHSRINASPEKYVDHVYGETEAGGTGWLYLAGADFNNTELPKLTATVIPNLTETIQHGVFKSFVPPLALYGLLGLIMHSLRAEKNGKEESRHE
ncbi:4Fe-4S ferredoxin [candidate division GN15 bacterium]|uniref:4Fe-4S ferredoxin n=1 Tax=candidate division GN15 bacterium TaxID=2072418 RepID=A0A855X5U4_9BACT|nr:MAG: 4Fe-4S ferredoxin [candidate division GN15 bacterium]